MHMEAVAVQRLTALCGIKFRQLLCRMDCLAGRNDQQIVFLCLFTAGLLDALEHDIGVTAVFRESIMCRADFIFPCFLEIELCVRTQGADRGQKIRQIRLKGLGLAGILGNLLDGNDIPFVLHQPLRQCVFVCRPDAVLFQCVVLFVVLEIVPVLFQRAAADFEVAGHDIHTCRLCKTGQIALCILRKAVADG